MTHTNAINTITTAVAAYVAARKTQLASVAGIVKAVKGSGLPFERKALAQPLMVAIADAYGIALVPKVRGEGHTWGDDNVSLAAKQCHKMLLADIFAGEVANKSVEEPVKLSAEQRALLAQLDATFSTYVDMRRGIGAYIAVASSK